MQVRQLQVVVATLFACQFESLFWCLSHYEVLFIGLCALIFPCILCAVVVCRNAVSPPELARYAPVLYVLEPVLVGVHILSGVEVHFSIQYGRQSDVGKVLHAEEPLEREARLYGRVRVAL